MTFNLFVGGREEEEEEEEEERGRPGLIQIKIKTTLGGQLMKLLS